MNKVYQPNKPGTHHGPRKGREGDWGFPGCAYTTEEVFWLRAVGNKMHMWPDFEPGDPRTLIVAKTLGYRKDGP